MIDFVLGAYVAGLMFRGWIRGMVREVADLAGLVVGLLLAFRLNSTFGAFATDRFGLRPEVARIGAGLILFLIVGAGMSLIAHYLTKLMRLPGLNLTNRFLGAGVGALWALTVLVVLVTALRALPVPEGVEETLDRSRVVELVAGPGALPRSLFERVAGDESLRSLLVLKPLFGILRLTPDQGGSIAIPATHPDDLKPNRESAEVAWHLLNGFRDDSRRDPLAWSEGLADVAFDHALWILQEGSLDHEGKGGRFVDERVALVGLQLHKTGETIGLASDVRAVHQAFVDSESYRSVLLDTGFDRVGVGAVEGPLGLLVVMVFGG